MDTTIRHTFLRIACAWMVLGGCTSTQAAEWYTQGSLSQRLKYDDNIGLKSRNEISDLSWQSILKIDLGIQTESLKFGLKPGFKLTKFMDENDLDSNDQRVTAYANYHTTLSNLDVTTTYDRDTTRSRDEDDTGEFILDNVRRKELEVKPSWSYRLTPVDTITIHGEYNKVSFDERLINYTRASGVVGWSHQLSKVEGVSFQTFVSSIKPETSLDRDALTYGIRVGWNIKPVRSLDLKFSAGVYRTEFIDQSFNRVLPTASLLYKINSHSSIHATFARSITPSGNGEVLERDRADLAFKEEWNSRVSWGLNLRYQTQQSLDDNGRADRDFLRIEPTVDWRYTKTWSLLSTYRFRWQKLDNENDRSATSSAVMLTLSYRPMKW